jgi:bifunctional non-homologous end joining protein LigD
MSALRVGDRTVEVTNLEKVLYPKTGFTKGRAIDYYSRIAPALLPHLRNRPVTLKWYPDGVEGFHFYEKRCPPHQPNWVKTASGSGSSKTAPLRFCLINDLPSLVWARQLANLELHTLLARAARVACPTAMVFDLDPGAPAGLLECAQTALWLRQVLNDSGLESTVKTSGSKGLQLYVSLNKSSTYDTVKLFARSRAEHLEADHPEAVVSRMAKSLRPGKVFIDWSQNTRHKTTVAVYSLRARPRPTVSTPLTWVEVLSAWKARTPDRLVFEVEDVLKRVDRKGDLFIRARIDDAPKPAPGDLRRVESSGRRFTHDLAQTTSEAHRHFDCSRGSAHAED